MILLILSLLERTELKIDGKVGNGTYINEDEIKIIKNGSDGFTEWITHHHNSLRDGLAPEVLRMPLTEKAVINGGGKCRWTDPVYSNGKIVFTTSAGFVYCVDTTGNIIWNKDIGASGYVSGTPTISNNVVYVQMIAKDTTYRFFALNFENGDTIWSRPVPAFSLYSQPLVKDGSLYFGDFSGNVHRWDAIDGDTIWSINLGGAIYSACAYSNGIVFTTSYGTGKLYAIDTSGIILWEKYIGPSTTAPTIANNKVFTINRTDGLTSCFDAVTGDSIWQVFTQTNDGSTMAADDSLLYFGSYRGKKFYCLRQSNGSVKWQKPIGGANGAVGAAVAINGNYFFGTAWDGNLYIHNKYNGTKLYTFPLSSYGSSSSVGIAKGYVFVGDEEGRLHIFKGSGIDEAPTPPSGLYANPGDRKVFLWWNKNPETDISGYKIYHRLDGEYSFSFVSFTSETSYIDTGLINDSLYHFVVIAVDTAGSYSDYSNEVTCIPGDTTRPSPISDLNVSSGNNDGEIKIVFTAVGDDGMTGNAKGYEIRYSHSPINNETDYINATIYNNNFVPKSPGDTETFILTGFIPDDTLWFSVKAFDESYNYSLLGNTDSGVVKSDIIPPGRITDLIASTGINSGEVNLYFTSTGDDGSTGNASGYIIKYYTEEITDLNWDIATTYNNSFIPKSPGQPETLTISGLTPNTNLWFAIKVFDEKPNYSDISNSDSAIVCYDPVPPSPITDLVATTGFYEGEVNLVWTATGDDGTTGTAKGYILKYSHNPITNEEEFNTATEYIQNWKPLPSGSQENKTLTGLPPEDTLYFSIKANDDANNYSPLGNSDSAIVQKDIIPPSPITTLTATTGSREGEVNISWIAVGGDGNTGTATGYILKYSNTPITTEDEFNAANTYIQNWTPLSSGSIENKILTNLPAGSIIYFSLKAFDNIPNYSALGNSESTIVQTDVTPPAKIEDLVATGSLTQDSTAILQWTSVGDDSLSGQAAGYIVKYYSLPIVTSQEWDNATLYNQTWTPLPAGETEYKTLYPIPRGTWYFAIMVRDEKNNFSPISNTDSCKVGLQLGIPSDAPDRLIVEIGSNPSFASVKIKIGIPENGDYSFIISDLTGRIVKRLKGRLNAGFYNFNIDELSSGTYFVSIEGNKEKVLKRFVLIK